MNGSRPPVDGDPARPHRVTEGFGDPSRGGFGVGGLSMNGLATLGYRATLRRSSPHVVVLRLLAFVAPLVVLGATMAALGAVQPVACFVFGVLALACALSRDAHVGMLTMLLLGLNWVQTVDDPTTPWVLLAAAGLVLVHASMAAITVAPPSARWRTDRVGVWAWRSLAAAATAIPVWLLARAIEGRGWSGNAPTLTAALVLVAVGAAWLRRSGVRR